MVQTRIHTHTVHTDREKNTHSKINIPLLYDNCSAKVKSITIVCVCVCLFHTKSDHLYSVYYMETGNNTAHIICMISYIHYLLYQICHSNTILYVNCINLFFIVTQSLRKRLEHKSIKILYSTLLSTSSQL